MGDKEFGPRRKNYLHFPLNGAGIRRGIKPTGGRIKRQLVGGMERMHKFHNGHLSLGRVRAAVGGGPPRVYRHQNNHSISPPWANNIQTHPSQTHQNSKKNGQEILRSKIIRKIRQFSQDGPSILKEHSVFGCFQKLHIREWMFSKQGI